jgi:3-keto-5-aminohexanoate cleavage enzyme
VATPWNDKLIILVAPTGETPSRDGGPNVPTNPEQIAEEVFRCYQAGASIVHVHARDRETKLPTSDIGVFKEIFRKIRERCDILIQATGAMGALYDPIKNTWAPPSDEERMALLNTDPKPDLTCVPTGSSNYSGPAGKFATLITTADFLRKFIRAATTKRIKWEMEIWDVSYLHNAFRLAEEGVFDKDMPLWLNYCLGDGIGSQPATPRQLIYVSEEGNRLFPRAIWELIARGQNHFQLLALGMILGCHIVRVGFEDHIYLPNGKIARNNIELVECAVKIAKSLGRDIATVTEAKQIMSLPG